MPETADVIIIGAGVIGAATAFELAKRGYATLSLDRNAEASLLRHELSMLPNRELILADRRSGLPGLRVKTADLDLACSDTDLDAVEKAGRSHPMLAPVKELERGLDEAMRRVYALLVSAEARAPRSDVAPLRRARGGNPRPARRACRDFAASARRSPGRDGALPPALCAARYRRCCRRQALVNKQLDFDATILGPSFSRRVFSNWI